MNLRSWSKHGRWKLVLIVSIIALVAAVGLYAGITHCCPMLPCPSSATLRSFVIIANDTTGYNGSRYQPFQMNAQLGDCVLVSFVNNSSTQAHGLAIVYYVNSIVAQPNKSASVKFQTTKTGQFQVSEPLLSTINAWTDRCGTLNVT